MNPLDCLELYEDADFYDTEFASRDHELPFFLEQARRASGPVLEIACGTGRLTLPIAAQGIDVTGLDVSLPMLEKAKQKAVEHGLNIPWVHQDCRAISLSRQFGLIFSATNAMQHLHDIESVHAFLTSARDSLTPDGVLLIDVFNPDPSKLARKSEVRYLHKMITAPDGSSVRVEASSAYRAQSQVLHFDLFYLVAGREIRRKQVNMRCFFPEELLALSKLAGLEVIDRLGDYDGSPLSDRSPKQLLFCKRKR
jgi:SAM-dependent methyltransferase